MNDSIFYEEENEFNSKSDRIYIAYGSNMDLTRLKSRCPDSEFIGLGVIEGYRLVFRKSASGFYASIDKIDYKKKKKRKSFWKVPVALFRISQEDENNLDIFEGFPRWYKKVDLEVKNSQGKIITGMGYVLPETSPMGTPNFDYYSIIESAYNKFGIDLSILEKAFKASYKAFKKLQKKISRIRYENYMDYKDYKSYLSGEHHELVNMNSLIFLKSNTFLKEFKRLLEGNIDSNILIDINSEELYIVDLNSGETYFVVYPPSGSLFYIENILENDYLDYNSIEDAIDDIASYFKYRIN